MPVSRSNTRAALAVGATPNTSRPWRAGRRRRRRACGSCRRRPGRPPTPADRAPATAAAASACSTSSPDRSTVVDGAGGVGLGVDRPGEDVLLLGEHRLAGEVRGGRFDPHRAAIRRPPQRVVWAGRDRRNCSITRSAARSRPSSQRRPDICDTGRWRSQIARSTSGRPHVDRCADTVATTSSTVSASAGTSVAGRLLDRVVNWSTVQPTSAASVCHRVPRSAAPCPVLRPRVSAAASRLSAARSSGTGPDLRGRGTRRAWRRWRRRSAAVRLENTDEQLVGDAGDLGLPVDDRPPRDPEAVGQLGAQHRLVQPAEHPLMPLQVAGVERPPAAVVGLHLGRDHGVGVDLRVVGPRRRLPERGHRQPVRVGMQPAAVEADPGRRPEPLQMLERRRHGDVVGVEQPGSPVSAHHTDSDFGAENVASNPATARTTRPSAEYAIEQLADPAASPRRGSRPDSNSSNALDVDRARQAEPGRLPAATTRPAPRPAPPSGSGVVRRRRRRRRRVQGRHPQHRRDTHRPPAGTCLSNNRVVADLERSR